MRIAHLTASPFFGGPERQMLGLALSLPADVQSVFLTFSERGLCRSFLGELRRHNIPCEELTHNAPHVFSAIDEITTRLRHHQVDLVCCHGYKPNLLGRPAARRLGIPAVAVSRGWTWASWKVRCYEALDRYHLRYMDRVVCVSNGQAEKVRRAGTPDEIVRVIHNSIFTDRFGDPDEPGRAFLQAFFRSPRSHIIGAAGRLSPEKGFADLVTAASEIVRTFPDAGFLLFGDGPLQSALSRQIESLRLGDNFVLAGFRADLDRWLPNFDAFVLPSYTEGLPNVVLEACAARVPVVATAVGGTPEVLEDGQGGYLVSPRDPSMLADRLRRLLADDRLRETLGMGGYYRVRDEFTFNAQASQYMQLFHELLDGATTMPLPAEDEVRQRHAG